MNRVLVISDLHLSHRVQKRKLEFLKKLVSEYDQVIINGDFWDNWFTTFDKFINSKWQELFPLLKEKNCIYITGNHDPIQEVDDRCKLFCNVYSSKYEINFFGTEYYFVHGNEYLATTYKGFLRVYSAVLQYLEKTFMRSFIYNFLHTLEKIGYFISSEQMINSKVGGTLNERFIEKYGPDDNRWVVFAHTHTSLIDKERTFANSGCVIHGVANYLEIDESGLAIKLEYY